MSYEKLSLEQVLMGDLDEAQSKLSRLHSLLAGFVGEIEDLAAGTDIESEVEELTEELLKNSRNLH